MTLLNQWIKPITAGLGLLALAGCAQLPHNSVVDKPQEIVFVTPPPPVANGSLFQGGVGYIPLFEDRRPRNIGDTLTIVLDEQVSASKSSGSNATRSGSAGFTPGLLPEQLAVLQDLGLEVSGNNDFAGGGGSNANNSFTGTITVTVIGLLPNGNLNVRGEKHIGINQGKEYIRFSGMVNPRTISAQNSVPSTQVAEARIEYVGDGYINEAQHMGWLQRFFLNIAPF